jgi:hypothetical protein
LIVRLHLLSDDSETFLSKFRYKKKLLYYFFSAANFFRNDCKRLLLALASPNSTASSQYFTCFHYTYPNFCKAVVAFPKFENIEEEKTGLVVPSSVADPGSDAFLTSGSGIRIRDEHPRSFFREIPDFSESFENCF